VDARQRARPTGGPERTLNNPVVDGFRPCPIAAFWVGASLMAATTSAQGAPGDTELISERALPPWHEVSGDRHRTLRYLP
jgi:hypothetical protein